MSLHIGVNEVDPGHYWKSMEEKGWKGRLEGCENDARAMHDLAVKQGFEASLLITREATRENVKAAIEKAAKTLGPGDFFFLTYSGHGSQVADISGDEMNDDILFGGTGDTRDETWCLYDKQLLDDELLHLWAQFKKGVRILIFSDSCHSGTVSRGLLGEDTPVVEEGIGYRLVPRATLAATYIKNQEFYNGLQSEGDILPKVKARVLLFSGCQDDQLSQEDQLSFPPHGFFTLAVLNAWKAGDFENYTDFFTRITEKIPKSQTPNRYVFGEEISDFESGKPLTV